MLLSGQASEADGESIIYKLHQTLSNYGQPTVVGVTKLIWDTHTMRYVKCRDTHTRSVSAPPPTSSLHLQKLFQAAQDCSSVGSQSKKPRPHTSHMGNVTNDSYCGKYQSYPPPLHATSKTSTYILTIVYYLPSD